MRVVVVGATGNVGTALLRALADEPAVDSILGLARRLPVATPPKTDCAAADIETDALERLFEGADAIVHLAWRIQPSRRLEELHATNVRGSARVFAAAARARVPSLVYASSVGAYSPGPKDRWSTSHGQLTAYGRASTPVIRPRWNGCSIASSRSTPPRELSGCDRL